MFAQCCFSSLAAKWITNAQTLFISSLLQLPKPSKRAGSDLEMFGLRPIMAITASMQPDLLHPVCSQTWAGSDICQIQFPTCILFVSILQKKAQIILCKSSPDLIWMSWLGFGWHLWSRRKLVCKNHWTWFWQNATSPLPVSYFQDQMAWIILCKTSLDPIWFWLTVSGFGQKDKIKEQASVQESSDLLLANASTPIQIRCKSDQACLLRIWPLLTTWMNSTNQPAALCSSILWSLSAH